jgi:hypothetical protein
MLLQEIVADDAGTGWQRRHWIVADIVGRVAAEVFEQNTTSP